METTDDLEFVQEEEEEEDEYSQPQPWDGEIEGMGEEEDPTPGPDSQDFVSYEQVLDNLAVLQVDDAPFQTLHNALNIVHDHFNNINCDTSVYQTILEKIGCTCEIEGEMVSVSTLDGTCKGKDAIRQQLHKMIQTISVIHLTLLLCSDIRATTRQSMTFENDDINTKLAELYYRQSAFSRRVFVDFDVVHPMASTSQKLLNRAKYVYQEHAAFYKFIEGMTPSNAKSGRNVDMLFMVYYTVYKLAQYKYRVCDGLVYKEVTVQKRTPIPQGIDDDNNPIYPCSHTNALGARCNVLRHNHRHPINHLYTPEFEVHPTETWNTHHWKPITDDDFEGLTSPTLSNFIYHIVHENGKAEAIVMSNSRIPSEVEKFLIKSRSSMVKFLKTRERTYACWNGVLDSSKFYPYESMPLHLTNVCVDKFFPKWYFYEEDERAMRGKPCAELTSADLFRAYKRDPRFRYTNYTQNIYCTLCGLPRDRANHSKCGYHSPVSSSSSSSSAIPTKWAILCANCMHDPTECTCDHLEVYKLSSTCYMDIPTIFWDQLIQTQIRGMTIRSPTEPGATILLPSSEYRNTGRWVLGFYFRPNFRIGPHARKFESDTEEQKKLKSIYADCWRVAFVVDGETGTGKSASSDMISIYLPEFGELSDKNQDKFMLQQCIDANNKFKPIKMGEMGANTLGRTIFCALVDANTVIPVPRKGILDVNAVCDRGLTLLCNKFSLAGGDVEGSVKSRLAMVKYQVTVPIGQCDGMIHSRNASDPIPLARKGNWAYEDISSTMGNQHFEKVCPVVFVENRARFEEDANVLRQFLNDPFSDKLGALVLDKDVFMKRKDLIDSFKDHCSLNNVKFPPWRDDHYDLRRSDIRPVPVGSISDCEGNVLMERYVYGIAPRSDPNTIRILEAKTSNLNGVDNVDEEEDEEEEDDDLYGYTPPNSSISLIQLLGNASEFSDKMVECMNALSGRSESGVSIPDGFLEEMAEKIEVLTKCMDTMTQNAELEEAAQLL